MFLFIVKIMCTEKISVRKMHSCEYFYVSSALICGMKNAVLKARACLESILELYKFFNTYENLV